MKPLITLTLLLPSFFLNATPSTSDVYSGGKTTVKDTTHNAYSLPAANLPITQKLDFSVGNSFFRNPWVQAPSSTTARDGLGPLFNTNGCQNCHIKDGRGHPPEPNDHNAVSMLVRLSIPAFTEQQQAQLKKQGVIPEPTYGGQLQDFANAPVPNEGKINITYTEHIVSFDDGYQVSLRKPTLTITELGYGKLHPATMMSARVAPPMIGLGLLESIDEKTILAHADPEDKNQDGISGRPNYAWDHHLQRTQVGRFGWKAGQPSLMQQNAAAFNGDLGITSLMFPHDDCTAPQKACSKAPSGGIPEVSEKILKFVEFYTQHLAVPARRNSNDPLVIKGQTLFNDSGCNSCHIPQLKTAHRPERPALSEQVIWPYTDLLLHDMGEGLADQRPEFEASGTEWRTPALWGIGLTKAVNDHTYFLHDGRARNLMEAVLWHAGEAEQSKQQVLKMNEEERAALLAFLNSL
ncbi:di-heme oxidoredictase family protein [Zooshikella ganghwensis]|uniref:di-heme oxidoreductase family protein n=1 Tax=Zooshikella ganghwensis TaxID=202772 RepID=UPI00040B253F|nr:di-heme oxidoredictase family protein [Zooshikella ganghwensis]